MFYLTIEQAPDIGPDRVRLLDDRNRFTRDFVGRDRAITWLVAHGCCPGAAAMLHDCWYGQPYSINDPADVAGRGATG